MEQNLGPARPVPPGRILRQELEARGWTQRDLAAIIGRPEQVISEIISGAKQITPETSVELSEAIGTSPEFWYRLETNYRLQLARRAVRDDSIARRSRLYGAYPLREMARRGWLALSESVDELEAEVNRFFGGDVLAAPETLVVAARLRCSTMREPAVNAQLAWLRRAEQLAREQTVGTWHPANLESLVADLTALSERADDVALVPQVLARWGVRSVFLPHLSKTYLDGAAFYVDGEPVVALTLRYDRIDAFWFTLLHEIAHLAEKEQACHLDILDDRHDPSPAGGDDDEAEAAEPDEHERRANELAGRWLIDPAAFRAFVAATQPLFHRDRIMAFAVDQRRHPGIVLGRLQREGLVPYKNLRGWLVKVSPHLRDYVQD